MNLSLPGYVIFRESSHDQKHVTYRGVREKDQTPILVKTFSMAHPRLDDVARLKNEFELLNSLKIPSIVKAYALEQHQNGFFLILEDSSYIPLEKLLRSAHLKLEDELEIAIHLVQALADLQTEEVIHKDLQPENILVQPDSYQVKLTGFNYATKIRRQRLSFKNPTMLEGSLPYMSPEQTGRMNREVDYRTDFYSLGVTLYRLFTGQLPFKMHDPMELVHAHIAKTPPSPSVVSPETPEQISKIILKLLSKKAEDRYSSTFSLLNDFKRCKEELKSTGKIDPFPIAQNDVFPKLQISQKIYGRDAEIQKMLNAFDEVCRGETQLVLLAGYPGIGKTSIVHEIHKPILEKKGFFIAGKYDQYKANIPYSAFIEAFQDLIQQILTENDDTIAMWREKIKAALGANASVIVEVIPELRLVLGDSIPVQEFDSQETQNRFNFFFQRFISLYASAENPLVIFLDDLQWVDSASLQLLEMILTTLKTKGLFLIGAYRNNEVSPLHPLITATQRIGRSGGDVIEIEVPPLPIESVNELIKDTLHLPAEKCKPLSEIIFEKTHGNPFFTNQLLIYLYEEGLLYVDQKDGVWSWDKDKVETLDVSDNVVDLLITKLQKCSLEMQEILEVAACIGNHFDVGLTSTITGKPFPFVVQHIMEAIKEGFILPSEDIHQYLWMDEEALKEQAKSKRGLQEFRFLHDKVQQAAYQLMSKDQRKNTHYQIGLILLKKYRKEQFEEHIFEVMSQLNHAADLISEKKERNDYAKMNLLAAQKAMRTVAYATALDFLNVGLSFLPQDKWESEYALTLELYLLAAEANYLLFNFEEASRLFDLILEYTKTHREKISVYKLKVKLYISSANYKEAIRWGGMALKLLGVNIHPKYLKLSVVKEFFLLRYRLIGKDTDSLLELPQVTDPDDYDTVHLIMLLITPAYLTSKEYFAFMVLTGLNYTLKLGNAPMTSYTYASYGVMLNVLFEDFKNAYSFGKLALDLNRKFDDQKYVPATKFLVGTFLNPTINHLKTSIDILQTGYELGTSTGDFINAVFCQGMMVTDKYLISTNIDTLRVEVRECLEYVAKIRSHNRGYVFNAIWQSIKALKGETYNPSTMQTDVFNEEAFFQMLKDNNFLITMYFAYTFKMQICYLFENYEQAIEIGKKTDPLTFSAMGQPMRLENDFYHALSLAGNYSWKDHATQRKYLKKIKGIAKRLHTWAKTAPSNYLHKYLLVMAEVARIEGDKETAFELYDEAIESARENSYTQNEGIANELFAKFYLSQNRAHIAKQYLIDAHYAFYRWGATAKLAQLEQKYAGVFPVVSTRELDTLDTTQEKQERASDSQGGAPSLDLMAVIKGTQTISGEIVLSRLLDQLMQIVVETAGAEKASLILEQEGAWLVEAEFSSSKDSTTLRPHVPFKDKKDELSTSIINFVLRTKEQVVLDDATNESIFVADPYITTAKPQSILCFPLLHQGKLIGVLYLENNLTTRAFTPSRVEVLKLLTTQIATSLENSMLYSQQAALSEELKISNEKLEDYSHNLEKKVYDRTRELNEKNNMLEETLTQIKEMQKKLIEQEKLVSQVAVTKSIATEMRNPLNYIYNFATLTGALVKELEATEKVKENQDTLAMVQTNLKKIYEHSKKADEIIASMIEDSQYTERQKELTDINKLIRDYADLVYYNYYKNDPLFSLTLETDYDPTIGKVNVYPQNLGRVFYNIIDNACYATDVKKKELGGNFSPIVSISTKNDDQFVIVKIRDNGTGIKDEVLSKVFSPFLTTKPAGKGAGMGLSISHDIIVQDHNGTIKIDSQFGQFTEVTITLPKV